MFVNLSRRSQTLTERQRGIIESLEQSEQDESRLGSLFRPDRLATRMRRNPENLLVPAGHEAPRECTRPESAPVGDAAQDTADVRLPVAGQLTDAGLPRRVPSANLVPGSAGTRRRVSRQGRRHPSLRDLTGQRRRYAPA